MHSWINECTELFGILDNVRSILEKSMGQWKSLLTSSGEDPDVKKGAFQVDSLSPLLFVLSMVPLLLIFRKVNASYEWRKKECKLNHLLFMDDLKLFSKSEEQVDTHFWELFKSFVLILGWSLEWTNVEFSPWREEEQLDVKE